MSDEYEIIKERIAALRTAAISAKTSDNEVFLEKLKEETKVSFNLEQKIISTTEDKLTLCLIRYKDAIGHARSWIAPLGILITLILAGITTDFKDALFLSHHSWKAIWVLMIAIDAFWLFRAVWRARTMPQIEDIVGEIGSGLSSKTQIDRTK